MDVSVFLEELDVDPPELFDDLDAVEVLPDLDEDPGVFCALDDLLDGELDDVSPLCVGAGELFWPLVELTDVIGPVSVSDCVGGGTAATWIGGTE